MLVSECRRPEMRKRVRSVNSRYFENIGPAQAYWLGYLLADGCIGLRKRDGEVRQCVLQASSKDKEHLEKLSRALGSDYQLYTPGNGVWHLAVPDYDLCLSLEKHGIIPAKSFVAAPPKLDPQLESHWVRGVIDGDGCFNRYWRDNRAKKLNGKGRPPTPGRYVFMLWVVGSSSVTEWFCKRFGGSQSPKARVWQWGLNDSRAMEVVRWAYENSAPEIRLDRKYEAAVKLGVVTEDSNADLNVQLAVVES